PSPLLLRRATGVIDDAMPREVVGSLLGVFEGEAYRAHEVALAPGDTMILFSDGVTDAMNVDQHEFGSDAMRAILQAGAATPAEVGQRILDAVKKHSLGCRQHDDITLVCLGRLP